MMPILARTLLLTLVLVPGACVVDEPTSDVTAVEKGGPPAPKGTLGKPMANATGSAQTFFGNGSTAKTQPFFASLGTNGRTCGTCHAEATGFTVTPAGIQARFDATQGNDPIFRTGDGTVSPTADVSSVEARRTAYGMLLAKGLIRVGMPIPGNAEFALVAIDDPYGHADASDLSLFRRPLPSTNLGFLATIMWDGREASLGNQAHDATMGHAQATGVVQSQMDDIVAFESSLLTAQTTDAVAGDLLKVQESTFGQPDFYVGINDPLGHNPNGTAFDPHVFSLFDSWRSTKTNKPDGARQASIYRGQQLFNDKPIAITGVGGLNDMLGAETITGTCSMCHDTPNIGNHSYPLALNLGLTDAANRTPDMPLYTLQNTSTGATVQTTDPGRALVTGKWADIGKFKGPILRAVGTRPPYFHNGMAATLDDLVSFYDSRFDIGFTAQEHADLVAFLQAL